MVDTCCRCCVVVAAASALAVLSARPVSPAAGSTSTVISVETARGLVSAVERASRSIFTFTVKDAARLADFKPCTSFDADVASLKPGQAFAADLGPAAGTKSDAPCCTMTSAPGSGARVLGIQPHGKFDGVEVMLMDISRTEGDLARASVLYCNGGQTRVDLASDLRARESNAKLLDLENKVEHEVVRAGGPGGRPMVSDHGPGLKLDPHQTARTWMTFSAPKGNLLTLHVPGAAAPFERVKPTQ